MARAPTIVAPRLLVATVLAWSALAASGEGAPSGRARDGRSCFGVRLDGHVYTAEGCCDVRRHGEGGDRGCWGYDEELGRDVSFQDCCVGELLADGLLADRPPLILDLLLALHPEPSSLWRQARELCARQTGCGRAEVHFSGLQVNPTSGLLETSTGSGAQRALPRVAYVDVGAHVKSRFLERLDAEPHALLVALEPDRASCRYQLDYARRTLSADSLARFWLLPVAAAPEMGLAVLHRANHFYDGQCSSLLPFKEGAVAWEGCTEQTGEDVVSTIPLAEILRRLPESIEEVELKVDVQGFDLQALLSAGEELRRVARLTVEVQDLKPEDLRVRYVGQRSRAEIEAALHAEGFVLESCEPYTERAALIRETDCRFVRQERPPAALPGRSMKLRPASRAHLVTLAEDEPFTTVQRRLGETATMVGFLTHRPWSLTKVMQRLGEPRKNPLTDLDTGSFLPMKARWWKPFVILDRLWDDDVQAGDWVIWQDSTSYVPSGFNASHAAPLASLLGSLEASSAQVLAGAQLPTSIGWGWGQRCVPNYSLSPRDWSFAGEASLLRELCAALARVGACADGDDACCEALQAKPMLQNSWLAFRKGKGTLSFVEEWLRWNVDSAAMRAMPFADQSLFELVAHGFSETVFALESATLKQPVLDRAHIAVRASPTNEIKHLGVALNQLQAGGVASVKPLGELQAEWRRGIASKKAWRQSLCRF